MAYTFNNLKKIKLGLLEIGVPVKYIPKNTIFYFLKLAIETSFKSLGKNQRSAIKTLFAQNEAIDEYLKAIKNTKLSNETLEEIIKNHKRYLYTGSCMLNTMYIIAKKPNANFSEKDKEIINYIFN